MFDIAWSELALIGGVALVVIGPKDMPRVMRAMGRWTRKARLLAGEFQRGIDEMMRESELAEMKRQVQEVNAEAMRQQADIRQDMQGLEQNLHAAAAPAPSSAAPPPAATAEETPPPAPKAPEDVTP
ncbi:Sec-independent protein translocase protein TatB [mine drainage metagenome]|uniref:Sec-independent protein translocase protein TatB n=1 Tax=mine drainage metagenome TaxID=410659 RepID=A0A1J5R2I0_9ZZZZ